MITESFSLFEVSRAYPEVGILLNDVHSFANSTFPEVLSVCFLCLVLVSIRFDSSAAAYSKIV